MLTTLSTSIDYISIEGLPWILAAWVGLVAFRPFATLVHESGHLWTAFILCKGPLTLRVGRKTDRCLFDGNRIRFEFSLRNGIQGQTEYSEEGLGVLGKVLILSAGPLFSIAMSCLAGWLILRHSLATWSEVCSVSWFCANFLAFLRASIPTTLRPNADFPEGAPSDGLQILRLLKREGEKPRN